MKSKLIGVIMSDSAATAQMADTLKNQSKSFQEKYKKLSKITTEKYGNKKGGKIVASLIDQLRQMGKA